MYSFVEKNILTEKEEEDLWQRLYLISNIFSIPLIMISGRLSDNLSAKIFVPACIVFNTITMAGYLFMKNPRGWFNYVLAVFQSGSGFTVTVSMMAYLTKRIPKMIRGMMFAVCSVSSCIGSIIYL